MTDAHDWQITLPFAVPNQDTEGPLTKALLRAAMEHAPPTAAAITAHPNPANGQVLITLTLPDTPEILANDIATDMLHSVRDSVLAGHDAVVTPL